MLKKKNKSHSSIGCWPQCDLFFIVHIHSLFEINFFYTGLIFFTRHIQLWKSDLSIYKKICSFEFQSLKLGGMPLWCVKLVSIIKFRLILVLEFVFKWKRLNFVAELLFFQEIWKNDFFKDIFEIRSLNPLLSI